MILFLTYFVGTQKSHMKRVKLFGEMGSKYQATISLYLILAVCIVKSVISNEIINASNRIQQVSLYTEFQFKIISLINLNLGELKSFSLQINQIWNNENV